jgi:hypothetical protein
MCFIVEMSKTKLTNMSQRLSPLVNDKNEPQSFEVCFINN